jgi:hypothetical protein
MSSTTAKPTECLEPETVDVKKAGSGEKYREIVARNPKENWGSALECRFFRWRQRLIFLSACMK